MTRLKVLHLAPQARVPDRMTRATFIDEEIRAVAAAGIEVFVLSAAIPADTHSGSVWLKSIPARRSLSNRLKASRLLVRPVAGLPVRNWTDPRHWYQCGWFEYIAAKVVLDEGIDLIHSHFAWPNGQGGMIARAMTGRPLVAVFRGNDLLTSPEIGYGARRKPAFDRAVRGLLRTADRTIYFSDTMRRKAVELGASPETARLLHKGVNTERFFVAKDRTALRQELGFGTRPMIMTVAGLITRKGVHHILEALARLRGSHDFTFVIVGQGPERARLAELSGQLGLQDKTVFMGRVDRQMIPKYFAACDLFVLASLVDAAPNVILEAMSAGRPVVTTASGGAGEFTKDGETGFVVPVADTGALAARIQSLLSNPALCEQFGAEGRRRAVIEFSNGRMASDIIDVYRDLMSEGPRNRVAV